MDRSTLPFIEIQIFIRRMIHINDIVKSDLHRVFAEFYLKGKIRICINSTFISLVPKKDRSIKVKDFCPISLVSSVYL